MTISTRLTLLHVTYQGKLGQSGVLNYKRIRISSSRQKRKESKDVHKFSFEASSWILWHLQQKKRRHK